MKTRTLSLLLLLLTGVGQTLEAQHHRFEPRAERDAPKSSSEPCFDASNPAEHKLWHEGAPGAVGDDPCRDVPYLTVYPAAGAGSGLNPAILIFPGGGYDHLTNEREQEPVAEYFAQHLHVTAILLRYRLAQKDGTYAYPTPMWDAQRAIRLVHTMAARWQIDPERIGVFGFSAGGHLASTVVLHPEDRFGLAPQDRVDESRDTVRFLGLGYPVISMDPATVPPSGSYRNLLRDVDGEKRKELETFLSGEKNVHPGLPPVFLFESLDDKRISAQNSVLFAQALQRAGVPAEIHLFQHGEHGSGLSEGIAEEEQWPQEFGEWLKKIGF